MMVRAARDSNPKRQIRSLVTVGSRATQLDKAPFPYMESSTLGSAARAGGLLCPGSGAATRVVGMRTSSNLELDRVPPAPVPFACEANRRTMSPPTREDTPHLGAGSRYGPTPDAADGRADRPPPATAPPAQEHPWPPTPDPGARPHAHPSTSPTTPLDLAGSISALAALPEVLTAREAAAILRVGRNQLYQAVARSELGAVRIGRSIRIPKQALLDLLAAASPG
jgi:excisionase family DNA binding protein